jgi:uncharacterized protein (TIGR03437 family)
MLRTVPVYAFLLLAGCSASFSAPWDKVYFEANKGQAIADIEFIGRSRDSIVLAAKSGVTFTFGNSRLLWRVEGSRRPTIEPLDPLEGKTHYLIGNDRAKWRRDVPQYGRIRYREILPGVDAVLYGSNGRLEYDFDVAPGADPKRIAVTLEGGRPLRIDSAGNLVTGVNSDEVIQKKPVAYQLVNGTRREVPVAFQLAGAHRFSFTLGEYDRAHTLHIDPVLEFATYLGGTRDDFIAQGIGFDSQGNIVIAGSTQSTLPATAGALRTTALGGFDGFVAKLDPTGSRLLYLTYMGGTEEDRIGAIATDASGAIYLTGSTRSRDYPSQGDFMQSHSTCPFPPNVIAFSCFDAFVTKLSADGRSIVYSFFLGGPREDVGTAIAVDSSGNAYVTGTTVSPTFPNTVGIQNGIKLGRCNFVTITGDGCPDIFVTKINAAGTAIVYSALFGSAAGTAPLPSGTSLDIRGEDKAIAIAVDRNGSAYITGSSVLGVDFPVVPGSFMSPRSPDVPQNQETVVVKLRPDGGLAYTVFLGGSGLESGTAIAVDAAGAAYVTGSTRSDDFPATAGAPQTQLAGNYDLFVTKINPAGTALVYSTYFGGNRNDSGSGILLDPTGAVLVTGASGSSNFPTTADALQRTFGAGTQDVILAKLNPSGNALMFSTFLGGSGDETGHSLAFDAGGKVLLSGTVSRLGTNFPTTAGALQTVFGGATDSFLAKLDLSAAPPAATHVNVSAASFESGAFAPESFVSAFGANLASDTLAAAAQPLPATLAGTTVRVRDSAGTERQAGLQFVSPGLVNYLMPPGTAVGNAVVTISNGAVISQQTVRIETVAPGIFTANSDGQGAPAAFVVRASGGRTTTEFAFSLEGNRFVPAPIDFGPAGDQLVLVLFGTGIRNRTSLANVSARIGGTAAAPLFAGAQGEFAGLDQVNLTIDRSLAGSGLVTVNLTVDGKTANPVQLRFR